MPQTVFYSWQSDLPSNHNRNLIGRAVEAACKQLSDELDVELAPDRDTQGVPGAPDIAATILAKIRAASAVVADVSIVTPLPNEDGSRSGGRPSPNPNVMVEVGYAKGALGEGALLLVMNTDYGDRDLLPFDLRGRRVTAYSVAGGPTGDEGAGDTSEVSALSGDVIDPLVKYSVAESPSVRAAERELTETLVQTLRPILKAAGSGPDARATIVDQTDGVSYTPVGSLDRINNVLGWGQTPEMLDHTRETIERLFDKLRPLPRPTREILVVMARRADNGGHGNSTVPLKEIEMVTGLSGTTVQEHLSILRRHGLVSEPYQDDYDQPEVLLYNEEWPIWPALLGYTREVGIPLERIVVDLQPHLLS